MPSNHKERQLLPATVPLDGQGSPNGCEVLERTALRIQLNIIQFIIQLKKIICMWSATTG